MNFGQRADNSKQISNVARIANNIRNINFDTASFIVQKTASGLYVSNRPKAQGPGGFDHHFKTYASAGDISYTINEGYWRRNGITSAYDGTDTFDPITDEIVGSTFTGKVYNYVVRPCSYGTTGNLIIVMSGKELFTLNEEQDQFHMEELISIVNYVNGKIDSVEQYLVGSIDDTIDTGGPNYYEFDSFGLSILKDLNNGSIDTSAVVGGGQLRRRDQNFDIDGLGIGTLTGDIFVSLVLGDMQSDSYDPSIYPTTPFIDVSNGAPVFISYAHYFFPLWDISYKLVSLDGSGGSSGRKYSIARAKRYHEGAIYDDWVRPDGIPSGNYTVDFSQPMGRTLDFITQDCPHRGELQDYAFYEQVVQNAMGQAGVSGDQIIPWYEWSSTITEKTYARLDAKNAEDHGTGMSLWIYENYVELYKFKTNNPVDILDLTLESPNPYRFLVRKDDGNGPPKLMYADLSYVKVEASNSASTANEADYADIAGNVDSEAISHIIDQIFPHSHSGHDFQADDHIKEGTDRYVLTSGDAGRNNMSGKIGDAGGNDSVCPNDYELKVTGNVMVDWADGTLGGRADWSVLNGTVFIVQDPTDSNYAAGTGSLQVTGGASIGKKLYVADATDAGVAAGAIATGGGIRAGKKIYCADGTDASAGAGAIYATGGISAGKKIYSGSTTDASDGVGAIFTTGGISCSKKLYVSDDTTGSTLGGAIYTKGGIHSEKAIYSADATLASSTNGAIYTAGGGLFAGGLYVTGNMADTYIATFSSGGQVVSMGGPTYALHVDGGMNLLSGDYYHAGDQGQTLTGWYKGGIVTGNDIIEIDASDLQSTDKILVRR